MATKNKKAGFGERLMQRQPLLNREPEFLAKCNAFMSANNPKQGELIIGENGIEFRAILGNGFLQIPWRNIKLVRAQIVFFGKYVRGFFIDTDDDKHFNLVVSHAREALRIISMHLPREKMAQTATLMNKKQKQK
ncbi:MAG: DUF956 family protein [Bifidobacteriaceae bacterium]|nr:DUF956 family protein [Bifidobacteriaceae bacterium]